MFRNSWVRYCLLGLALVGLCGAGAMADLMIDVRAESTDNGLITNSGKTVTMNGAGNVTLGIYAVPGYLPGPPAGLVGGTNAQGMVQGDIVATGGAGGPGQGIDGYYTYAATDASFSVGSQNGTVQDVNGDSRDDIGTTITDGFADDEGALFGANPGNVFLNNTNGLLGIKVGTATYTVSSAPGGTAALLNFWRTDAQDILGTQGQWREVANDTVLAHQKADNTATMGVGLDVEVNGVPEPSTLVLLGMGAMGLGLAWWRKSS